MLLNEVETSIKNPASLLLCDNIFLNDVFESMKQIGLVRFRGSIPRKLCFL